MALSGAEMLKFQVDKSLMLRGTALLSTALCAVTLCGVGEPRTASVAIIRGLLLSVILNGALWLCSFKVVRAKLRLIAASLVLVSGLGVFLISPFGWTLALALLLFHVWVIVDLIWEGENHGT